MSSHSNRLYDHFQRERSAFGRTVLAVTSIGVFFALVFEPYLATLSRLADLDRKLIEQAELIAKVQTDVPARMGELKPQGVAAAFRAGLCMAAPPPRDNDARLLRLLRGMAGAPERCCAPQLPTANSRLPVRVTELGSEREAEVFVAAAKTQCPFGRGWWDGRLRELAPYRRFWRRSASRPGDSLRGSL